MAESGRRADLILVLTPMTNTSDPDLGPSVERIIRARRMIRSFTGEPLAPETLDRILELARRAPSAGNTMAVEFLVLDTRDAVDIYWTTTLTTERRERFRSQGLLTAPALVVITTQPAAYVDRYAEDDKARPGLGERADAWAQPFWWIDAGMVAQNLLLLATANGLGAALFGIFDHEPALRATFAVPDHHRLVCTVALGVASADNEPGRSAGRPRPALADIMHRGRWSAR